MWTACKHAAAVIVLLVGAAACGDDKSATGTTVSTASTASTAVASTAVASTMPAGLESMLLTAGDVGAEWQVGHDITPEDLASVGQSPCPDTAMNPTILARLTAQTGIQFDPVDRSYRHLIELLVTGDPQRLATDLDLLFEATMQPCPTVATTAGTAVTARLTIQPLAIPELGDQRRAVTMIGQDGADAAATWYVRSAVVRVGSVAVVLGLTEILSSPDDTPQVDDAQFVQILQTAVAKLGG